MRRERRAAGLHRPSLAASLTLHLAVLGGILFGPGLFAERTYLERHTVEVVRMAEIRPKPIPATPTPEEEPPPPAPAPEAEPLPEEPPEDVPVLVEEEAVEPDPEPQPSPPPPEPAPEPRPQLERPFQQARTVDDSLAGSDDAETPVVGYDSDDFTYEYYTDSMLRAIEARWTRPPMEGVEAVVFFRVASDGTVSELELIESSGVARFDNAGLRAIELASPLPPLPVSFHKPSLGVTMRIK